VKEAALLYWDVWRFLHEMILDHQNTPRRDLDGMTPNEKWLEGVEIYGLPQIPQFSDEVERLFWRMSPETRQRREKGISFNGMHYWSPELAGAPRVDRSGKPVEYTLRTDVEDISHIALFKNGIWVGDAFAQELRYPDGTYRRVSAAERDLAKALAVSEGRSTRDWLRYINENVERNQKRIAEKKKAQRAPKSHPVTKPSTKDIQASGAAIERLAEQRNSEMDERTLRLARFGGKRR
jgi:hypothetical protein